MRERRLNPILGIIIIIVGGCAIGILLSMLINDGQNANNNVHISPTPTQAIGENIQSNTFSNITANSGPTSEPQFPYDINHTRRRYYASIKVKGLYLTTNTVGNPSRLNILIDLANKTEINHM